MMDDITRHESNVSEGHLSEDQLDEVLMEIAEPAVVLHAETCTACAERLEMFRSSVGAFNEATMAWSEAHASNMPAIAQTGVRGWLEGRLPQGRGWTYAGAAMAGVVMLVAGAVHDRGASAPVQRAAMTAGSDYFSSRQQEISSDNAMLSAISAELYQPVAIPEMLSDRQIQGRSGAGTLPQAHD